MFKAGTFYLFKNCCVLLFSENMKSSDAKASKCHLKFFFFNDDFYQTCIFISLK